MKLVLAIDLHGGDPEGLVERAVPWAARLGATLDLVWVDPFGNWKPFTLDAALARQLQREVDAARQRDLERLRALLARVPPSHRGEARALSGEPAVAIPEAARGYALLLLGPGGQLGDRLGLGSLESQIVRHAPTSVLVLREPGDRAAAGG